MLTEAGTRRRASLHLLAGREALAASDPGGIDVMSADPAAFTARLQSENHTLKRALTNPRLFSGIGNAYSDEILHRARLSPVTLTRSLDADAAQQLLDASQAVMQEWTERLRAEAAGHGGWPKKVTAFRPEMAVHGRYGQPCPVCGSTGAAHRPRGQRDQLLRALPDRRQAARRPRAVAAAQGELAAAHRRPRSLKRLRRRGRA